jgi:hypothetical protein
MNSIDIYIIVSEKLPLTTNVKVIECAFRTLSKATEFLQQVVNRIPDHFPGWTATRSFTGDALESFTSKVERSMERERA